jgi:type III restriction enzyme
LVSKRSIFNKVVADNKFELEVAEALAGCLDIVSFAKLPRSVGFRIEYRNAEGSIANYYPDFVVKETPGRIWVVETKGREDLDDPPKWARLKEWCQDATAKADGREFRALFVRQEDWERYRPKTFAAIREAFEEKSPEPDRPA